MNSGQIWIDADAAPREVKELVFRAAKRLDFAVVLVANQPLTIPAGNPKVSSVRVKGGPDVADRHIIEHAAAGDLAITADIPLAAALVERQVRVIDPRGEELTADNIGGRLSLRNMLDSLRGSGEITGGPAPYSTKDKHAFATTLDQVLTKMVRKR